MPFGLTNCHAVFQTLVRDVHPRHVANRFLFVYLDDILIYSRSAQEHVLHVRQVLQRVLENQLFVKAEKCEFHRATISFLGYIITAGNMQMDPDMVRAVRAWNISALTSASTLGKLDGPCYSLGSTVPYPTAQGPRM